ncbi:MAG TPA: type II toxin-antitoxin system VapC family toxin [Candidatus Acidoferrum sp.]|jgi:predicted nucleic-acid-binding protein
MLAVDTNILVRFLTGEDSEQATRAATLFSSRLVWISKTVLLETSWVLESDYGLNSGDALAKLKQLAALPNVRMEDALNAAKAFEWAASGIQFADALHLASRGNADSFLTFDRKFAKRAKKLTGVNVATL